MHIIYMVALILYQWDIALNSIYAASSELPSVPLYPGWLLGLWQVKPTGASCCHWKPFIKYNKLHGRGTLGNTVAIIWVFDRKSYGLRRHFLLVLLDTFFCWLHCLINCKILKVLLLLTQNIILLVFSISSELKYIQSVKNGLIFSTCCRNIYIF